MAKVIWGKSAQKMERQILRYAVQNYTKASCEDIYKKFREAETNLAGNPFIGAREYYLAGRSKEYRSLFVPKYFKLVYYYDEAHNTVRISDVWDTRKEPVIQASRLS